MYKVHVGYTQRGKDKWRRFKTIEDAKAFCEKVYTLTGVILSIIVEE